MLTQGLLVSRGFGLEAWCLENTLPEGRAHLPHTKHNKASTVNSFPHNHIPESFFCVYNVCLRQCARTRVWERARTGVYIFNFVLQFHDAVEQTP